MAEWLQSLRASGLLPEMFVVEICAEDVGRVAERRWVGFYHESGHPILNVVYRPLVKAEVSTVAAVVAEESELLMGPEAAELLGVSDARIRQLCLEGAFVGAMKRGNWWFIPRTSVEAFQSDPSIRRRKSRRPDTERFLRPAFTSP